MNHEDVDESERWQEDSEVEISDLDGQSDLSEVHDSWLVKHWLRWQRSGNRKRIRVGMSLGIVFLVLAVLLLDVSHGSSLLAGAQNTFPSFQFQKSTSAMLQRPDSGGMEPSSIIFPHNQDFVCLIDAGWSPDSQYVALIGYQQACDGQGRQIYMHGLLAIYSSESGKIVSELRPGAAIMAAFQQAHPGVHVLPVISYSHMLWKADGAAIALTFNLLWSSASQSLQGSMNGMVLVPLKGEMQVLLQQQSESDGAIEWDVLLHQPVPHPALPRLSSISDDSSSPLFSVASVYQWGSNGALFPVSSTTGKGPGPQQTFRSIGNPGGEASFSVWQPGGFSVEAAASVDSGQKALNIYTWHTDFLTWSPDGRYLVDSFDLSARLNLAAPPSYSSRNPGSMQAELLPSLTVEDKVFPSLIQHILNMSSSDAFQLAWQPGGNILAAYDLTGARVELFNWPSGKKIVALDLSVFSSVSGVVGTSTLRWSPDGSRLLVMDSQLNIGIWHMGRNS